jgi:hypothetical protein
MNERSWLRRGLFAGALALGLAAVPGTVRAQDAAKTDDANKQDSAQPAAGAQQGQNQGRRGRPGGPGGPGGFGARNPAQAVDRMREDTSALKLRDDQKAKLDAVYKEASEQAKSLETETQSLEPRERAQKVMPFMRDLREKVNGVLDDGQRQELRRSQATRMSKQMSERMKENLGQLNLTPDQQKKVDAVLADMEKKAAEAAAQGGDAAGAGGQGGGRGGAAFGLMRETRDKINEILTPEQQQKFQELAPAGGRGQGGAGGRRGGAGAGAGAAGQ